MFCEKCGAKIKDDALFCRECGAAVKRIAVEKDSKPRTEPEEQEQTSAATGSEQADRSPDAVSGQAPNAKKSAGKIAAIIGAVLVAVVLVIFAVSNLGNGNSDTDESGDAVASEEAATDDSNSDDSGLGGSPGVGNDGVVTIDTDAEDPQVQVFNISEYRDDTMPGEVIKEFDVHLTGSQVDLYEKSDFHVRLFAPSFTDDRLTDLVERGYRAIWIEDEEGGLDVATQCVFFVAPNMTKFNLSVSKFMYKGTPYLDAGTSELTTYYIAIVGSHSGSELTCDNQEIESLLYNIDLDEQTGGERQGNE